MFAIQPVCLINDDEELRTVSIGTRVCHWQQTYEHTAKTLDQTSFRFDFNKNTYWSLLNIQFSKAVADKHWNILPKTHTLLSNWRLISPDCVCFRTKFSSSNLRPYMDFPPVPLWLVKSPPWHINWGMIRWKQLPLNPKPFSCVHRQRKFSTGKQTNKTAVMSWGMSQWKSSKIYFLPYCDVHSSETDYWKRKKEQPFLKLVLWFGPAVMGTTSARRRKRSRPAGLLPILMSM